jgi:hypothetical protein
VTLGHFEVPDPSKQLGQARNWTQRRQNVDLAANRGCSPRANQSALGRRRMVNSMRPPESSR